ncbi:MAG: hypothetical protein LBJ39_04325 [Tannerellaceae bacterium]|jgi:hypothetical protein|nr:hypothetical protein [Tannerellaceae bacterium]
MELKKYLDLRNVRTDALERRFDVIAKLLLQTYHIQKGTDAYDFLEVEFYYYTEEHKDVITYPRTSGAGKWFFHQSGVDITFESEHGKFYGGILVRSLLKNGEEVIAGPLKCKWNLFDAFDAFEVKEVEQPLIKRKKELTAKQIFKTRRQIACDKEKAMKRFRNNYDSFEKFLLSPYRYYVRDDKWKSYSVSQYNAIPWGRTGKDEIPLPD